MPRSARLWLLLQARGHGRSRPLCQEGDGARCGRNHAALRPSPLLCRQPRPWGACRAPARADFPDRVERLAVLDIVPTIEHFERADMTFAMGYYHWFWFAQP